MDFDESWPMPTERMEVEVVTCTNCGELISCPSEKPCCYRPISGPGVMRGIAPEDSLTAALLRLGLAAEAWFNADAVADIQEWDAMEEAWESLAALRTARGA